MGYETDEYYDEQGRRVVEIDYSTIDCIDLQASKQYVPIAPRVLHFEVPMPSKKKRFKPIKVPLSEIRYKMGDMTPTIRDPRCNSNTDLACFWPVYVGNFKDDDVANYFAYHGLHARWWFHRKDTYYREFQSPARLYDMLVYFVSERDAELAIKLCHRDIHKGYKLNVFPGREPVYFKEDRSVLAYNMKSGRIYSEHFFERHVSLICKVNVNCVVKFDMKNGALEFDSPSDVRKAQQTERMWTYIPVEGKLQKQRFLEKDVLSSIENILTQNPSTLKFKNNKYAKMLLNGYRLYIDPKKKYKVIPLRRGPGKNAQIKLLRKKMIKKYGWHGF